MVSANFYVAKLAPHVENKIISARNLGRMCGGAEVVERLYRILVWPFSIRIYHRLLFCSKTTLYLNFTLKDDHAFPSRKLDSKQEVRLYTFLKLTGFKITQLPTTKCQLKKSRVLILLKGIFLCGWINNRLESGGTERYRRFHLMVTNEAINSTLLLQVELFELQSSGPLWHSISGQVICQWYRKCPHFIKLVIVLCFSTRIFEISLLNINFNGSSTWAINSLPLLIDRPKESARSSSQRFQNRHDSATQQFLKRTYFAHRTFSALDNCNWALGKSFSQFGTSKGSNVDELI